ncbi:MAG: M23 family metallopeptidase [Prochlorococcaceae cyanobacterium]
MPSDCSEYLRRCLNRLLTPRLLTPLLLGPALLGTLLLGGSGTIASSRWRLGVFPVISFAGFTSHYGQRIGPSGRSEPHYGLDIAAPLGSPIRSWWAGRVESVINDSSCGVGLVIRSGPYEHIYCHLAGGTDRGTYRSGAVRLQQGQAVRGGQLIAHVGLSGRTTGPHLHWGIRHEGQWLDPARVLRAMASSRNASAP